jgi:hypothetical protein
MKRRAGSAHAPVLTSAERPEKQGSSRMPAPLNTETRDGAAPSASQPAREPPEETILAAYYGTFVVADSSAVPPASLVPPHSSTAPETAFHVCDYCRGGAVLMASAFEENPETYCGLQCQQNGDQRYHGHRAAALAGGLASSGLPVRRQGILYISSLQNLDCWDFISPSARYRC